MSRGVRRSKIEDIFNHGYFFRGHSSLSKALDDVTFNAPRHGTYEAFRRRGRECRAYLQELRHERSRIVGDPVAHHDAAAWLGDSHHLAGYVEWFRGKHGTE